MSRRIMLVLSTILLCSNSVYSMDEYSSPSSRPPRFSWYGHPGCLSEKKTLKLYGEYSEILEFVLED